MLRAWALTVNSDRYSRAAISRFVSPAAMCWSTSSSRLLRSSGPSPSGFGGVGVLRAGRREGRQQPPRAVRRYPAGGGVLEQAGHRRALIHEDLDVALRFGKGQGALQGREGRGRVAKRLVSECLQHQDLDHAPDPAAFLRRMQEALEQSQRVPDGAVHLLAPGSDDEHPGKRDVFELVQVAEFVVNGQPSCRAPTPVPRSPGPAQPRSGPSEPRWGERPAGAS